MEGLVSCVCAPHGTYIRWYLRNGCARMKENSSFRFVIALDLIKGLKQLLLLTCAPMSELSSNIPTMLLRISQLTVNFAANEQDLYPTFYRNR